ncbi:MULTISPECIES: hypothetical protein [unclassified Micromonospora]
MSTRGGAGVRAGASRQVGVGARVDRVGPRPGDGVAERGEAAA